MCYTVLTMSRNDNKVNSNDNSVAVNAVCSDNDSPVNNSKVLETKPQVRNKLVSKAVEFLVLESIQKMPTDKKIKFLLDKGLTENEIQYSIQRAAMICYDKNIPNKQNTPPVHYNSSNAPGAIQASFESQSWYSRLFGPIAFAAAVVYIGYKLYKKYIENWLFGTQKSLLEERLESIEMSVIKCIMMLEVTEDLYKSSNTFAEQQKNYNTQVRAELKSIKGLLLNRFQFPPAPASSSIPQWQLSKNTKPQVEQQNKINSSDIPNSLQTSENNILNETQKSPVVGLQLNGHIDSDNDKNCIIINSTSNETLLPSSSNQNLISSRDVDLNDSEHVENNDSINQ